jgi:hypothetical protein
MDWIHLARDRDQWRALKNMEMNVSDGNFIMKETWRQSSVNCNRQVKFGQANPIAVNRIIC